MRLIFLFFRETRLTVEIFRKMGPKYVYYENAADQRFVCNKKTVYHIFKIRVKVIVV